jgi:hypothetical protein
MKGRTSLPLLRASATTRWLACTFFSANEWPETEAGSAAAKGMRVHNSIASALGHKNDGDKARDEDEAALATVGVNYADALMEGAFRWTKHVEHEMRWTGGYEDEVKGTADFILVSPDETHAVLVDWKTGQRHGVYVDQMRTYAWLLSKRYRSLKEVDVRVVYLASGEEDCVSVKQEDIAEHGERMMVALSRRSEETPTATPGEWCQWCPAAVHCPKNAALAPAVSQLAKVDIDPRALAVSVNTLEEAQLAHALIQYGQEVMTVVENNLKAYVKANGGEIQTWEGQKYYSSKRSKRSLEITPSALEVLASHGVDSVLKPHATLTDVLKAASGKLSKVALEAALEACGAIRTTEYDTWITK